VDRCRLPWPGRDDAAAAVGHQIARHRGDRRRPGGVIPERFEVATAEPRAAGQAQALVEHQFRGEAGGERRDICRRGGKAVVGHAAGDRRAVLEHVQSVHVAGLGFATGGKLAGVT